jgi:hypothetical protein
LPPTLKTRLSHVGTSIQTPFLKRTGPISTAQSGPSSKDQADHATQGQLQTCSRSTVGLNQSYTTENQLADDENWLNKDNAWLQKSARSRCLLEGTRQGRSQHPVDTIANYSFTPAEVVQGREVYHPRPSSQIKAAFITLVNGVPGKKAQRQADRCS